MITFSVVALGYMGLSLFFILLIMLMNQRRKTFFASLYGEGKTDLDLDEGEFLRWTELNEVRFNRGWWRFVLVAYLCIHYPGLIVTSVILRKDPHLVALFLISAVVWLSLGYVFLHQ